MGAETHLQAFLTILVVLILRILKLRKLKRHLLPINQWPKVKMVLTPHLKEVTIIQPQKKRYVPRIIKVSENISAVPSQIELSDWDAVSTFANKIADDAVLPMKLYQSSLDGQGLNMKNDYVPLMKEKADLFEQKTRDLQKAVKAQNKDKAMIALNGINEAITEYRVAGKLSDSDGNIPSVEDMRRGAMRRPVVVAKK